MNQHNQAIARAALDGATEEKKKEYSSLAFILAYESGEPELSEQELIDGFQELINSGIVWKLQGSYGRLAKQLIKQGSCYERATTPRY